MATQSATVRPVMTTSTLSAWSADRAHRALGATTDTAARLAIALGSIRSVVRVIDRTLPPLTVDWERVIDDEAMSYTDLRGGHIWLNPKPVLDGRMDHGAALDVTTGFGMHEASHSQESRDSYEALLKKDAAGKEVPAFEPMRVAAYVWNVVEDVRIERVTASHWPGFAPYFDAVLDYLWADIEADPAWMPVEYGSEVAERLKTVFLACRFPAAAAKLPESILPEVAWWTAWQHDYLDGRVATPETIRRALDHLMEDFATATEMRNMAIEEQKERERGEKIRAQVERLMREGVKGTFGVCVTAEGEVVPLDAETAAEVDRLVRENLVEHQTIVRASGAANPPIRVRRPEETAESRGRYIGRPDGLTEALRSALVFRNAAPQHDVKLLKSGTLDDAELYRWGMGDGRVFSERIVEAKPDVFTGLLVDISGSMAGRKLATAQRLAQQLVWTSHDQETVQSAVWAHTGDVDGSTAEVYRVWERGDPLSRLGLISTLPHSDNYDGAAISYVVREIAEAEQPQKVLIVLADGLPAGHNYGGVPAANHVRAVVRWAASRGVTVWQIAVDPWGINEADQEAMFPGQWLPYRDDASLPRQLGALMQRWV